MSPIYTLTRSKRKTVSLSVTDDLTVQVKAPLRMPVGDINSFVEKHTDWISRQCGVIERRRSNLLSQEQIDCLRLQAATVLPARVAYYSAAMGVLVTGVKITSAQGRWGSCNSRNSICFSYRIMLLPPAVIDYIVVHELAHIRVRNHSQCFYNEIKAYMPDYRARVAELKRIEKELPHSP